MKKLFVLSLIAWLNMLQAYSQDEAVANANVPPPQKDCCSSPNVVINTPATNAVVFNLNNTLTVNQPISINTSPAKKIISIKAELTYFEFVPGSEDCLTCNKNSATFGNFSSGSVANTNASGGGTHVLTANFTNPRPNGNFPASFTITLPPVVKCCEGIVRWCIRYVISFDDCTVCTKVVCYERKKASTPLVVNPQPDNQN